MAKKIKDKERDSIDFGKSRIDPLFNSIFYPTLLSMVFASFFTVADGIFVGQGVGSNALAAINIVSPLFLITTGIALMFGVGVSVSCGQHPSGTRQQQSRQHQYHASFPGGNAADGHYCYYCLFLPHTVLAAYGKQ